MTTKQIEYCKNNLISVSISSVLSIEDKKYYLKGSMEEHLSFYDDAADLSDSELSFKYFKETHGIIFEEEDFDSNGNFVKEMVRTSVFQITTKDNGVAVVSDMVNADILLWIGESPMINYITDNIFKDEPEYVTGIFNYYFENNSEYIKYNDKESFIAIQEIGMY